MTSARSTAIVSTITVVALTLMTGCSGTAMPTPGRLTPPPLATAAPANGSTLQPAPAATGTPVDPAGYTTTLPAPAAGIDVATTDRNITCTILDSAPSGTTTTGSGSPWAACAITQKDFVFPSGMTKDPAASALTVSGTRAGSVFELGSFAFPDAAKNLAEDHSISWAGITCVAAQNGIRCTDADTSHGFFVSRVKYEVF